MCNIGIINFTTDWIWARIRCIMSSNECVPQKELLLNPMEEVLTTNLVHVPCFLHTDWVLDTLTLISILEIRREIQYLRAPMFILFLCQLNDSSRTLTTYFIHIVYSHELACIITTIISISIFFRTLLLYRAFHYSCIEFEAAWTINLKAWKCTTFKCKHHNVGGGEGIFK